ncbi:uncharacterized protein LOC124596145 [Schistocerca americana]|uniref:uncharacterized protein LOC124596145 n=1 Tax=Schistocerca americana TaxID=7009 RepID=UPI001F5016A9|nr:uncharacterized protein LOC124596145 [Schistocerca americana]XP_049773341.1 uncharacterized protein LOC126161486 [Schistocerca cancellata]
MVTAGSTVALAGFLVLCTLVAVESLECYECNSHTDSNCAKDVPPDTLKKDCSTHIEGAKYKLCRKIVQYIDFEVNGNKPEKRIIRTCGWDDSNYQNACYHRSGFGGRQEVCSCDKPLCNSAPISFTSASTMAVLVFNIARFLF